MRILLTGVTSATGVAIATACRAAGHDVIALHTRAAHDYASWERARLEQAHHAGVICIQHALRTDDDALTELVATHAIDTIIHHAGHTARNSAVDYDIVSGDRIHSGPLNAMFRALAAHSTSARVIITGTAAEYGVGTEPWRESDPCHPVLPYGVSKLSATQCAAQLALRFHIPTRVVRLFMPVGPQMNPDTLISLAANAWRTDTPLALSSCRAVRDFVGIADIAAGYAKILRELDETTTRWRIINLCSGVALSVREFLARWSTTLDRPAPWQFDVHPERPDDPPIVVGDPTLARTLLQWAPAPVDSLFPTLLA